ncbi:MAG TPA: hypothetical protein DCS97_14960 [Planctomycetes bacterium]|nr:hypothetical protein [Planctomycetota bacterium]
MATQCVRCGRVLNLEDRRCPACLASLTNQQIGQMELTQHQLGELARIEKANMTTRFARKSLLTGALVGLAGMIITLHPLLIIAGGLIGGSVGWFVAWRGWGQMWAAGLFAILVLPCVAMVAFSPFTFLTTICAGMVLGVAVELNRGG